MVWRGTRFLAEKKAEWSQISRKCKYTRCRWMGIESDEDDSENVEEGGRAKEVGRAGTLCSRRTGVYFFDGGEEVGNLVSGNAFVSGV